LSLELEKVIDIYLRLKKDSGFTLSFSNVYMPRQVLVAEEEKAITFFT